MLLRNPGNQVVDVAAEGAVAAMAVEIVQRGHEELAVDWSQ